MEVITVFEQDLRYSVNSEFQRRKARCAEAFTLIELLVVIAIIAILAAASGFEQRQRCGGFRRVPEQSPAAGDGVGDVRE